MSEVVVAQAFVPAFDPDRESDEEEEIEAEAHVQDALTEVQQRLLFHCVRDMLSQADKRSVRLVSKTLNKLVCLDSIHLTGKITTTWYKETKNCPGFNGDSIFKWANLQLSHFSYYRNSSIFKNYWSKAVTSLSTLTIYHSSLECDGFKFLLEHCPVLRTLNLESCKLRDLSDYHIGMNGPPNGAPCEPSGPIQLPLENLSIESMNRIEQCLMDYLIERTGNLKSICVKRCFFQNNSNPPVNMGDLFLLVEEFGRNLKKLLLKNAATLTNYGFHENNFQEQFFTDFKPTEDITIEELSLTLAKVRGDNYEIITKFLEKLKGIQILRLNFLDVVDSGSIKSILTPYKESLWKFELCFDGSLVPALSPLNLDFLNEFEQLREIKIGDSKLLDPHVVKEHTGGIESTEDNPAILDALDSRLNPLFLRNLPDSVRKLKFDKYIGSWNPILGIPSERLFIKNLMHLEINGPWIFSMDRLISILVQAMTNLETLSLVQCGLTDMQMTGLSERSVYQYQMRLNTLIWASPLCKSGEDLAICFDDKFLTKRSVFDRDNRLFNLTKLKHLNLSCNPEISSVTFLDALRIPGLKTLRVDGCPKLNDTTLELICVYLKNLESLHVRHCMKMSEYGFNKVLKSCPRIKKIYATKVHPHRGLHNEVCEISPNYKDIVVASSQYFL